MEEMPTSFLIPLSSFLVPRLRFPRASAGFMILAASMLPSALPAARVGNRLFGRRACYRERGTKLVVRVPRNFVLQIVHKRTPLGVAA